jgi:hypothetical protein
MHIVSRPRLEIITVEFKDRVWEVRLEGDAYVPQDLGEYMCQRGLVDRSTTPNPKPQWEMHGGVHGAAINPFARYVKDVTPIPEN